MGRYTAGRRWPLPRLGGKFMVTAGSLRRLFCLPSLTLGVLCVLPPAAEGQTAYGVNTGGTLFRFDVNAPQTVTVVGDTLADLDAIDFRPGTTELYGIAVGQTVRLYQINTATAAATQVGAGFAREGTFTPPGGEPVAYEILPGGVGFYF